MTSRKLLTAEAAAPQVAAPAAHASFLNLRRRCCCWSAFKACCSLIACNSNQRKTEDKFSTIKCETPQCHVLLTQCSCTALML